MEEPQTAGSQSGGRRFFFQLSCNQASLATTKQSFQILRASSLIKYTRKRETKNNPTQLPKGKNLTYLHDLGSS
jgi:hypothetical protein